MDNDLFEVLEFKPTSSLEGDIFYSLWKRCFDLCKTLQRGLTPARNSSNSDLWKKSYEAFLTAGHVIQKIIENEILTFRQELSNADRNFQTKPRTQKNFQTKSSSIVASMNCKNEMNNLNYKP
jgi:hypothetical protein